MTELQNIIENAWEKRELLNESITSDAVSEVISLLDKGKRSPSTNLKTSLNEALRDYEVAF